jgi:hypothetical protein
MSKAAEIARAQRLMEGREPVWIVGRIMAEGGWSFQGVFVDELGAVGACMLEIDFVAPAMLNQSLAGLDREWQGLYFPLKLQTKVSA